MQIVGTTKAHIGGFVVFIVGIVWRISDSDAPWGLIGAAVGLCAVAILLLKDFVVTHGYGYKDCENPQDAANESSREKARNYAPWINAFGIALMLLAAFFQLASIQLKTEAIKLDIDQVVYIEKTGKKEAYIVHEKSLKNYLKHQCSH